MESVKDASHLYAVERRALHAERPGFRITELQISPDQNVPWHCHSNIQDTFYVLEGRLRLFLHLSRRLERLEADLTPSSDEPALTIVVTSVGKPDEIIEVRGIKTADRRRRRPWRENGGPGI